MLLDSSLEFEIRCLKFSMQCFLFIFLLRENFSRILFLKSIIFMIFSQNFNNFFILIIHNTQLRHLN